MNSSNPEPIEIEELLIAAGIDYEVVARCPELQCDICADRGLPAAA